MLWFLILIYFYFICYFILFYFILFYFILCSILCFILLCFTIAKCNKERGKQKKQRNNEMQQNRSIWAYIEMPNSRFLINTHFKSKLPFVSNKKNA